MPKVFISYRRTDTGYLASMLAEKLSEEFGPDSVFFDVDNIPLGGDFRRHLGDAVAGCDVLLALVGDQWLTTTDSNGERRLDNKNDFNRIEIEAALTRGIPVVPVLAGHATMPSENDLPESLRELAYRNAIELRSGGDLRLQLDRMISGLKPLLKIEAKKANIPSHVEPEPVRIKNPPKSDSKQNPKSVRAASSTVEPVKAQTPQREAQPQNLRLLYAIGALGLIAACLVTGSLFLGSKPNHNGDGLVENGSNTGGPENQIPAASESVDPTNETVVANGALVAKPKATESPTAKKPMENVPPGPPTADVKPKSASQLNHSPEAKSTTEEAFAEAEKLLKNDDIEGVVKILERALPGDPDNVPLLVTLAQMTTLLATSDRSKADSEKIFKASKYLNQALRVSPDIAEAPGFSSLASPVYFNEACALSVSKKPEQAMESLKKAVDFGYADATHMDQVDELKSVRALPGYADLKTKVEQAECKFNLEQIGIGLRKYHDSWNCFPPAHLKGDLVEGKPQQSWRVAILPFFDSERDRFNAYRIDEGWDGPSNKDLLNPMPPFYRCPSHSTSGSTSTAFAAITGKNTVLETDSGSVDGITDGTSNTLMVVEACGVDIPWMKPQDIDAASIKRVGDPKGASSKHAGGTHVLMADGSVRFISNNIDKKTLKALITRNGGEPLSESDF